MAGTVVAAGVTVAGAEAGMAGVATTAMVAVAPMRDAEVTADLAAMHVVMLAVHVVMLAAEHAVMPAVAEHEGAAVDHVAAVAAMLADLAVVVATLAALAVAAAMAAGIGKLSRLFLNKARLLRQTSLFAG